MSEAFNNIAEFIKVAKCMVPNIREIRIDWTYPSFLHSNRKYDLSFKDLVADILHGMPAVRFIEKTKLPLSTMLEPSSFQNLSSLTYVYCAAHTWFANVIRKRSRTLIELRLLMVPKAVMNNLIFDDNGNPIVYRLLKLLDISHDDTSEYKYLDSQVTHFPDIKRFVLFGEYPFATSQPFSSTISSLESLNISLFSFKSDCDKKIKALLSGKLQNLKTVCFFNTVNNPSRNLVERYRDDGAQIYPIEAILKNTNSIRNFKLVGTSFDKDVVLNMITTHTAFKHMHSIHVGYCNLEFPSIVQILALVPNLRYFCCGLASEFPQMDGCQQNELIQLIDAELSPMNKNIVTLDINNADSMPVEFIVETVAMLVIGCPRLSQLVIDLSDMYSFIDMVDDFARELPFPDHTSRLLGFTNNIYPQE
ncbi:hypothetical protein GGI05_005606 [Coemansia sp. RSA 2603]|nr:hypothetical protein GGI05_005606 [Coemansia sp. RSA 2603]